MTRFLVENGGTGKSAKLADLPISTKVQKALDGKANESSRLRAIKKSITSSTWAYDSVLYLGLNNDLPIVSIKVSDGIYAIPTTVPNDPMWYVNLYYVLGTKITSGTYTLEVTYLFNGVES